MLLHDPCVAAGERQSRGAQKQRAWGEGQGATRGGGERCRHARRRTGLSFCDVSALHPDPPFFLYGLRASTSSRAMTPVPRGRPARCAACLRVRGLSLLTYLLTGWRLGTRAAAGARAARLSFGRVATGAVERGAHKSEETRRLTDFFFGKSSLYLEQTNGTPHSTAYGLGSRLGTHHRRQ